MRRAHVHLLTRRSNGALPVRASAAGSILPRDKSHSFKIASSVADVVTAAAPWLAGSAFRRPCTPIRVRIGTRGSDNDKPLGEEQRPRPKPAIAAKDLSLRITA
jgi:hypothetical protein